MKHKKQTTYTVKDFLPLILISLGIIIFTTLKAAITEDWTMHSLMSDFMAAFFLIFGFFKIINIKQFASAYAMYDLIAKRSRAYALVYPFIELALGICYLLRLYSVSTNIFTLILMLVSAAGVATELAEGKQITCACLGAVFKIPMTYVTLLEDLLMATMALVMLIRNQ